MTAQNITTQIIDALNDAWIDIQARKAEVRPACIIIHREKAKTQRGHYWQDQWNLTNTDISITKTLEGTKIDEVYISSTILNDPATAVLETLIHEACHSLAVTRKIKDTSRNGRYHNKYFKLLAEEMGLIVTVSTSFGNITNDLTPVTKQSYKTTLTNLQEALQAYQTLPNKPPQPTRMIKLTCYCPRIIRASIKVIAEGPIACEICGEHFVPEGS